jgi:hypothetical protein
MNRSDCLNCRWWNEYKRGYGICRAAPPIASAQIIDEKVSVAAQWPLTHCRDECGAFYPRGKILEQSEKLDGMLVSTVDAAEGEMSFEHR